MARLSDARFLGYWLISAFAFTCHFSFIVISPMIFMEQSGSFRPTSFPWALLLYGVAYVFGGIVAESSLHRHLHANTQIIVGLSLIAFSGLVMLWLAQTFGLSATDGADPHAVCTAGTTIARPIANSKAMSLYPQNAGTSTSAGSTLIFMFGGVISAVINLSPSPSDHRRSP